MLSAFSVEHCPPSRWNTVRHQRGIVSAIAWNTHLCKGNARDPRFCMRIYFFYDENTQKVIVGHMPSHLPTSTS